MMNGIQAYQDFTFGRAYISYFLFRKLPQKETIWPKGPKIPRKILKNTEKIPTVTVNPENAKKWKNIKSQFPKKEIILPKGPKNPRKIPKNTKKIPTA